MVDSRFLSIVRSPATLFGVPALLLTPTYAQVQVYPGPAVIVPAVQCYDCAPTDINSCCFANTVTCRRVYTTPYLEFAGISSTTQIGPAQKCDSCPPCCPDKCDDLNPKKCILLSQNIQAINTVMSCYHEPDLLQWISTSQKNAIENIIKNFFGVLFNVPFKLAAGESEVWVSACRFREDAIFATILSNRTYAMDIVFESSGTWITNAACQSGQCPIAGNAWSNAFCEVYTSRCTADVYSSVAYRAVDSGCCDGGGGAIPCVH
jgi:hypothetical protein